MSSSSEEMYVISKPKWTWHKVNSQLLTRLEGKASSFSLQPTIKLEDAHRASQNGKLKLQLSVDTEKSLQFDDSIGWNWHKSSNLPIISLKAQLQNSTDSNMIYPLPGSFQARIFAVKILVNHLERQKVSHLEDVGLRGEDRIQISSGAGFFDGIRFKTTSYINEGVKFHLLIVFYIQDGKQNSEFRNIVSSVISPGIFVDSRKSARDHFEKRLISFTQIFDPQLMRKQFLKKSFKDRTTQYETKISNSLEGLYNYLTAPNIRHKVKHPFFLSVKFSNVFHIYFNSNLSIFKCKEPQLEPNIQTVMLAMQRNLIIEGGKTREKDSNQKATDRMFLISITGQISATKRTKIYQCLQFLNCPTIELVRLNLQVGPNYKNIFEFTDLVEVYQQLHDQLKQCTKRDMEIRKKIEEKNKGEYGDGKYSYESEKIEKPLKKGSEKPRLDINQNKISTTPNFEQMRLNYDPRSFQPTQHLSYTTSGLAPYYSSIIQQIDLQNELLQNIINQNCRIKQRMMYCWLDEDANRLINRLGIFEQQFSNQCICNPMLSQAQQNYQNRQQTINNNNSNNQQSQKWNKWSQRICLKKEQ